MSRRNPANGPLMQSPGSRPGSSGTPITLRPRTRPAKGLVHEFGWHVPELSTIHPHKTAQPRKGSGPQDDLLLVGRQLDIQAKVFAYPIRESASSVRIAMDHEHGLRAAV
jgi:hypothetical protein